MSICRCNGSQDPDQQTDNVHFLMQAYDQQTDNVHLQMQPLILFTAPPTPQKKLSFRGEVGERARYCLCERIIINNTITLHLTLNTSIRVLRP